MPGTPQVPEQVLPKLTALLEAGLPCPLSVTGNSMLPFLRHRLDSVILMPLSRPARRGDILFYLRAPGVPILHRVCSVRPDGILMLCGDAQVGLEPVSPDCVLARAVAINRSGRKIRCDAPLFRLAGAIWLILRPLRPYILAVLRKLGWLHEGDLYGKCH